MLLSFQRVTKFVLSAPPLGRPTQRRQCPSLPNSLFFNFRCYDLGKVGRDKVNKRLGLQNDITVRILTPDDLVEIVREMVRIYYGKGTADDIDHLGDAACGPSAS